MLKIEQFVKEHFDITLTPYQLEIIALLASGKDVKAIDIVKRGGKTTAYKAALAYLQDGLKEVKP